MAQLNRLVDAGNTVIVVEHDMDVVASADWVIDMGPAGGNKGGTVVATGTPEEVAGHKASFTGVLKLFLDEIVKELSRGNRLEGRWQAAIDVVKKRIALRNGGDIGYDFLIVATGATHSYFGNDAW